MQKVWFDRVWCMAGRWQLMSLEEGLERPRTIERAWLRQIYAPYWRGTGWALTVGPYSLRFGRCAAGIEIDESDDEFYWGDLDAHFDEHLDASIFDGLGGTGGDEPLPPMEVEAVTAFVDDRNQLIAVVHQGGEVEYRKELPREPLPWPP